VATLFAVYIPAFLYSWLNSSPYNVVADRVAVKTRDVKREDAAPGVDPRYADPTADPGQELFVEEEIVLTRKDPRPLTTLLTGLPSPSSPLYSIVSFLVNLAIVAMVMDLVYRAPLLHPVHDLSLARVGYVSDTTANILVREPDSTQLPLFLSYRWNDYDRVKSIRMSETSWKAGGRIDALSNATDFTGTFTVTGLSPDTRYEYVVSNDRTGQFTTAPKVGEVSAHSSYGNMFTFVHSSCVKLNFPYSPFAHPLSAQGFRHLNSALSSLRAQFMIFLGDFIYADVPHQHGKSLEDYRLQYRQVYASPDWAAATEHVPSWIHVYDDHEIQNDWSANTTAPFESAFDAYELYHTSVNPPPVRPKTSYFSFTQGPATFFLLDTRRYRSPNSEPDTTDPSTGVPTKSMLGAQQRADFLAWLRRPEPAGVRWKIVVSSVPFTMNWQLTGDTWAGFLAERQILLEAMWDVGAREGASAMGVVILSGDRHEFAATAFPPPPTPPPSSDKKILGLRIPARKSWPQSATVHEFSASPLNMFYLPVRTYRESTTAKASSSEDDQDQYYISDVCIKYIPDGNYKFGAVSISNERNVGEQSVLKYRLFVDGKETWGYLLTVGGVNSGAAGAGGLGLSRVKDAIWG
jgi:alkaline phosphatase D